MRLHSQTFVLHKPSRRQSRLAAALATAMSTLAVSALAQGSSIPAFSQMAPGPLGGAWHFATLPNKNPTAFNVVDQDGGHVLRVSTHDAYGNMVHSLQQAAAPDLQLQWRWRVDQLIDKADIKTRAGDDAALKLCVSFDFDKSQLSFGERAKLRLGRISTGEDIPAETLCYVWDNKQPVGTVLHNAFTHRMRYIVLQSGDAHKGQWVAEQRHLSSDYRQAFGDESQAMPTIIGITVSADSDNTHGEGLAYMGDIRLGP